MTTHSRDERMDEYLWDPAAPPAADVEAVERLVAPMRFEPDSRPLSLPASVSAKRARRRWPYGLAAAATIVVATGWSLAEWRLSWPAGRAWTIETRSSAEAGLLPVGSALVLARSEVARINIARIGTMEVGGEARVTLQSTQGTRHRLNLDRGTVRVRTWAPPGSVVFRTPVGEVIDLGCEFDLTADADRSIVDVRSGWVQIENNVDETLIPAGASSEMRVGRPPGVPVFQDATRAFAAGVRALEGGSVDPAAVRATLAEARARDVYTLLLLIERGSIGADAMAARAAELWPPPRDVTANGVARGDRDGLWRWRDTLPLPPPKGWLRNWRDALPDWLVGRR